MGPEILLRKFIWDSVGVVTSREGGESFDDIFHAPMIMGEGGKDASNHYGEIMGRW